MRRQLLGYLRLLPAVVALSLVVLVMKASGLAIDAHAADGSQAVPAPTSEPSRAPAADAASDEAEASSADVDVLTSLARRRTELDKRQHELEMRENLLAAAEKRVDDKIAGLKGLQSQIQGLLGMRDEAEQKQVAALVKTYSAMKPRDAGRIFDDLDEDVLLSVASQMKPDVLGPVLAQMKVEAAQKLTVRIAERLKASSDKGATAPAQLAAAAPTLPAVSPPPPAQASASPVAAAAPALPSPAPTTAANPPQTPASPATAPAPNTGK